MRDRSDDHQKRLFPRPLRRICQHALRTDGRYFRTYSEVNNDAGRPVAPTSEVVLGKPSEIDAEWRLFLVGGEVVTGSMYRPSADPLLPRELVDFAREAASHWMPASVFVLDIARVDCSWKIVECNCFNGSRFYSADVEHLVRRVSEHQERAAVSSRRI